MAADHAERERVEEALRRIGSDGSSDNRRRRVVHREASLADMVDTLESVREHAVANLAIEPEPEPFEPLEIVFEHQDFEIGLPGEVVQINDNGPILQFDISEKTGVHIDRAVQALSDSDLGGGAETSDANGAEPDDADTSSEDSDTTTETNPFLQGTSETLGGETRRSGSNASVAESETSDEESDSTTDTNPFLQGASETLGGETRRSGSRSAAEPDRVDGSPAPDDESSDLDERSDTPFVRDSSTSTAEPLADSDASATGEVSEPISSVASEATGTEGRDDEDAEPGVDESLFDSGASAEKEMGDVLADGGHSPQISPPDQPSPPDSPSDSEPTETSRTGDQKDETRSGDREPAPSGPPAPRDNEWWEPLTRETDPESLEADDIDEALVAAAERGEPGICILEGALDTAQVFVDGSEIYEITFDPPRRQRSLGWLFSRSDKISRAELERATSRAVEEGTSVATTLIREALLPRATVEAGRRARLRELLPEVRKRQFVAAQFQPLDARPDEFSHEPLSLHPQLFDHVLETAMALDGEAYRRAKQRFSGQLVRPDDIESFPLDQSPLEDRQGRFVDKVLDEPKTYEQLTRESTMYEKGIVRLLTALEKLGWISVGEWDEESKTEKRQAQKLVQLKTRLEGNNRFEELDVHWTAYGTEIEEGYEDASEAIDELEGVFEPESHEAEVLSELREKCEDNYEFLGDQQRRREYRRDVKSKFQIRSALQLYGGHLEQAQMQRDIEAVRDHCQRLLELDPGQKEAATLLEKLDALEDDD